MRKVFDLQRAIPAAFAARWEKVAASEAPYVTASDVEQQVRGFALAESRNEPWEGAEPTYGASGGIRISTGSRAPLLDLCRDWLLSEVRRNRLVSFNFGRGHISGMRFRKPGTDLTRNEMTTLHRRELRRSRPDPVHMKRGNSLLCLQPTHANPIRRGRSRTRTSDTVSEVTCERCRKLMEGGWCEIEYGVKLKWLGSWRTWSYRARLYGNTPPEEAVQKFIEERHKKEQGKLLGWRFKPIIIGSFPTAIEAAQAAQRLWPWLKVDTAKMDWTLRDFPDEGKYGRYPFSDALQDWEQEVGIHISRDRDGNWVPSLNWRSK